MKTDGYRPSGEVGVSDGARAWIGMGFCPSLSGPAWFQTLVLALAGANTFFWAFPTAEVFLAAALGLFVGSVGSGLRLRSQSGRPGDASGITALAAIAFGWSYWIYFDLAVYHPLLPHATLSAGALVLGFARRLRTYRFSASMIRRHTRLWDEDELADYAEFLLDRRPCAGAAQIARELYRRASKNVMESPWSTGRRVAIVKRYAELLESGTGGNPDVESAKWWAHEADGLDRYTIAPASVSPAAPTAWGDDPWQADGPGDATLGYRDNVPTWRITVAQPDRVAGRRIEVVFRAFLLPAGGLLACMVRFDAPGTGAGQAGSLVLHRLFDVSDPDVDAYLAASEHHLRWRVEIFGSGAEYAPKRTLEIPLEGTGFMETFDAVIAHNLSLGTDLDIEAALRFADEKMRQLADDQGIEAAWAEIAEACIRPDC